MSGRALTPLDALDKFGCFRLGARIWDLRQNGHAIEAQLIERNGKRFCEYSIPGTSLTLFDARTDAHQATPSPNTGVRTSLPQHAGIQAAVEAGRP